MSDSRKYLSASDIPDNMLKAVELHAGPHAKWGSVDPKELIATCISLESLLEQHSPTTDKYGARVSPYDTVAIRKLTAKQHTDKGGA